MLRERLPPGPNDRVFIMIAHSRRQLAGQAVVAGFPGLTPPAELLRAAAAGELGGFILFRRNLGPAPVVAELNRELTAAFPADLPPWLAVDQEGGRVQRLGAPVLQLPPMRAFGRVDDPGLTEAAAIALGRQLAALGFNMDFAPVMDVDSYAQSPVIGDRSFGPEPELVARHALAFARGLNRGGVAACGKHFPGHGATTVDSHLALPRLSFDRARLDQIELHPFRALAQAPELTAIMTAHIVVDALDPARPATLSPAAVSNLLRSELGYAGVIFSDDLEMKAIADHHGVGDAACAAIEAGCDVVLICASPELCAQASAALELRAERDRAFEARLAQAAERSLTARQRWRVRPTDPGTLQAELATSAALEARIAHALDRIASGVG